MPDIKFLGHSAFLLSTAATQIIIDPFLSDNPLAAEKAENIKADYVFLTHGHDEHLGDGIMIATNNQALVVAPNELAKYCAKQGCKTHGMNIGGAFTFPFGRVKVTHALHSSGYDLGGEALAYMGNPCGFLITLEGKTIYHAGDTGLFMDMQLIGAMNKIDVALLPIGDNFTMGIDDAVIAAEFLHPALIIPMHYGTFDDIAVDPHEFADKAAQKQLSTVILKPGESLTV